jgi:predicted DNA binding CopG/RHH family protein
MITMKLHEERDLVRAYEAGEMKVRKPTSEMIAQLQGAAEETFKKDKRINIRISSHDLMGIQRKALKKGIPYQALISGLIHQYVEGDLLEKAD